MIQIKDRFRPFSHSPGMGCMIPGSAWAVEAYPTEIKIVKDSISYVLTWDLTGPVKGFTVEEDLEKNRVRVFGRAKEGYFHFEISHEGKMIVIALKRGKSIPYHFVGKKGVLEKHQFLELLVDPSFVQYHTERLSLGVNKKLDWDLVLRRDDPKEMVPVLFFLGQKMDVWDGEFPLALPRTFEEFQLFFKHHFQGIFLPVRESNRRLGFSVKDLPSHIPLSAVLRKSYETIRSLFIEEREGDVWILPYIPKEFVSGRMTCLKTSQAVFDLEWTKGKIRRVRIEALQDGVLSLKWPEGVDSFRLKHRPQEKGRMVSLGDDIVLSPGQIYYLDKFQK